MKRLLKIIIQNFKQFVALVIKLQRLFREFLIERREENEMIKMQLKWEREQAPLARKTKEGFPLYPHYCHVCWKRLPGESTSLRSLICSDCQ